MCFSSGPLVLVLLDPASEGPPSSTEKLCKLGTFGCTFLKHFYFPPLYFHNTTHSIRFISFSTIFPSYFAKSKLLQVEPESFRSESFRFEICFLLSTIGRKNIVKNCIETRAEQKKKKRQNQPGMDRVGFSHNSWWPLIVTRIQLTPGKLVWPISLRAGEDWTPPSLSSDIKNVILQNNAFFF